MNTRTSAKKPETSTNDEGGVSGAVEPIGVDDMENIEALKQPSESFERKSTPSSNI